MKYVIKGQLDLKIGDNSLFPCTCELHIGGILEDDTTALLCGQCKKPVCLEDIQFPQLPKLLPSKWLQ